MRNLRFYAVLAAAWLFFPILRGTAMPVFDAPFERALQGIRLGQSVEAASAQVRAEVDEPMRRMMAGALFSASAGPSAGALAEAMALLPEYIPILAFGGDSGQPPSYQAVALTHLFLDPQGHPVGLRGPRLQVVIPEAIAVRVARLSLIPMERIPSPLREAGPDVSGAFPGREGPTQGIPSMETAFVAAARILEAAERWAGHRVDWGIGGRLTIEAYSSVSDSPLAYFNQEERRVHLGALGSISGADGLRGFTGIPYGWAKPAVDLTVDTVGDPDAAAHEAAHAVVNALKPGWGVGVSGALHEALADTMTVLTALEDPSVMGRVLGETGGAFRKPNEAALLFERLGEAVHRWADEDPSNDGERFYRSVCGSIRPESCGLCRETTELPEFPLIRGENGDPHCVALIVSGMLYDVFCRLFEEQGNAFSPACRLLRAGSMTGTLMLRSLRYLGEHRVSFRDYAVALLRADRDVYGGRCREILRVCMEERGLLDAGEGIEAVLQQCDGSVPGFRLDPAVTDPGQVRARVEEWESERIGKAAGDIWKSVSLIRHAERYPFIQEVSSGQVELYSDVTASDGIRMLRLRYRVPLRRLLPEFESGSRNPEYALAEAFAGTCDIFSSLVFDPTGRLTAFHADRPWSTGTGH